MTYRFAINYTEGNFNEYYYFNTYKEVHKCAINLMGSKTINNVIAYHLEEDYEVIEHDFKWKRLYKVNGRIM